MTTIISEMSAHTIVILYLVIGIVIAKIAHHKNHDPNTTCDCDDAVMALCVLSFWPVVVLFWFIFLGTKVNKQTHVQVYYPKERLDDYEENT